jgi:hypothetical protein
MLPFGGWRVDDEIKGAVNQDKRSGTFSIIILEAGFAGIHAKLTRG